MGTEHLRSGTFPKDDYREMCCLIVTYIRDKRKRKVPDLRCSCAHASTVSAFCTRNVSEDQSNPAEGPLVSREDHLSLSLRDFVTSLDPLTKPHIVR